MHRRHGFTIVELLIALAIIIGLLSLVSAVYQIPIARAQQHVLESNLRTVRRALQQFFNDHGRYPYNGQDEYGNMVTFLDDATSELVNGVYSGFGTRDPRRARYLVAIPPDPTLEDPTPLWAIVPWDNDGDWDPQLHDHDGTGRPSLGEPFVDEDPFGNGDEDGDGLIDEDPPDVRDIYSTNPQFSDL